LQFAAAKIFGYLQQLQLQLQQIPNTATTQNSCRVGSLQQRNNLEILTTAVFRLHYTYLPIYTLEACDTEPQKHKTVLQVLPRGVMS